jgi:hypothetical protein
VATPRRGVVDTEAHIGMAVAVLDEYDGGLHADGLKHRPDIG